MKVGIAGTTVVLSILAGKEHGIALALAGYALARFATN
jgi:hypothetical protein